MTTEPSYIFDPLGELEKVAKQADVYCQEIAARVQREKDGLADAKRLLIEARVERDRTRRAVKILKRSGY